MPDSHDALIAPYLITYADELDLRDMLEAEGIATYESALLMAADDLGFTVGSATLKNSDALAWIRDRATFAASSIRETFNLRLTNFALGLTELSTVQIQEWVTARRESQAMAVATMEVAAVTTQALADFYEHNDMNGECYFGGSPHPCNDCIDIAAGNPYTVAEMKEISSHPNCLDEWNVEVPEDQVPSEDHLWLGQ